MQMPGMQVVFFVRKRVQLGQCRPDVVDSDGANSTDVGPSWPGIDQSRADVDRVWAEFGYISRPTSTDAGSVRPGIHPFGSVFRRFRIDFGHTPRPQSAQSGAPSTKSASFGHGSRGRPRPSLSGCDQNFGTPAPIGVGEIRGAVDQLGPMPLRRLPTQPTVIGQCLRADPRLCTAKLAPAPAAEAGTRRAALGRPRSARAPPAPPSPWQWPPL